MTSSPLEFDEDAFDGVTRLFPLPGLVLYPHVVQALHIFEQRYRELLECAMRTDRLLSMAVLAEGWQEQYEDSPPVEPVVCLGQIITRTKLADGCSNILLIGLRRAKIVEELPSEESFRTARVELIQDSYDPTLAPKRQELHEHLVAAFKRLMPKSALAAEQLTKSLGSQLSLGVLTDLIAYSMQLGVAEKLALLGEHRVDRRAARLLGYLRQAALRDTATASETRRNGRDFPPDFSMN